MAAFTRYTLTLDLLKSQLLHQSEYVRTEDTRIDVTSLIPVVARSAHSTLQDDDLILWYQPSPEFFAALPEDIRKNFDSIAKRERVRSSSLVQSGGLISEATITPTARPGVFTYRLDLANDRMPMMTLYDLTGRKLKVVLDHTVAPAGVSVRELDLSGFASGVYLLDTSTEGGSTTLAK